MKTFVIPEDRIKFMMKALVKYHNVNGDHIFIRARAIYLIKRHLEFIDFLGGTVTWSKQ